MGALNDLYEKYRDRVEFFVVYIREAHPTDGWQVPANVRAGILVLDDIAPLVEANEAPPKKRGPYKKRMTD